MESIISLDLTGDELLKKPEYPPVEPAVYTLEVTNDCSIKPSKGANKIVELELVITDGPEKGKKIFDNLVLADKCRWKIAQFLESCGLSRTSVDTTEFKGKICQAQVGQEVYTNAGGVQKTRNVVESYLFVAKAAPLA